MYRISFGLVSIVLSLLLAARALDLATARYLRAVFRRVALANAKMMPRRARDTLDALAEGVLVLNRQQEIVFANREFARAAGIPREKLHGKKVLDLPWVVARTEAV